MLFLALLAGVLAGGLLYQWLGGRWDARRYVAPGRFAGGLHVYETGAGGPAVILEAGISASSLSWRLVQDRLDSAQRVASYDRAGYGWSPMAQTRRTMENLVGELHGWLALSGLPAPYILVGHSFGGLMLRHFAARYPALVGGLVLVDPLEPMEWCPLQPDDARRLGKGVMLARRGATLARLGVVRLALDLLMSGSHTIPKLLAKVSSGKGSSVTDRLVGEVRKMPAEVWPMVRAHWCLPRSFLTMAEYLERLPETCALPLDDGALRDVPLVVISASKSDAAVVAAHKRTAALSTKGVHVVAEESGHWVQLDRPEVVIEAIRRVS
ncbi:MAG TPA: alpha/beta hydrolase [Paludibaculum sp.]|jgi:pimeloyl-ACP methyl ester carboxylesterase